MAITIINADTGTFNATVSTMQTGAYLLSREASFERARKSRDRSARCLAQAVTVAMARRERKTTMRIELSARDCAKLRNLADKARVTRTTGAL